VKEADLANVQKISAAKAAAGRLVAAVNSGNPITINIDKFEVSMTAAFTASIRAKLIAHAEAEIAEANAALAALGVEP